MKWLFHLRKNLLRYLQRLHWQSVVLGVVLYMVICWLLLSMSGEHEIIQPETFFYWLVVTGSTVGYGDYSPTTPMGKWVTALWIVPVGLGIFGLAVGRIIAFVTQQWRRGIMGMKTLALSRHILVIGWNEQHTLNLLRLLLREERYGEGRRVVLCARNDIENPMPGEIDFVRVDSYSDDDDMDRTAMMTASCIIIDTPDDHTTMASALYCNSRNSNIHTIVYFEDDDLYRLLKQHCPKIECAPSVATEMLAKAAVDPGSSMLHHELLNVDDGMTQYSVIYPKNAPAVTVESLFIPFKRDYEATIIGIKYQGQERLQLNPALETIVEPGTTLFYIADERLLDFSW
ncbi:voltage-gated potassium channel [Sinobacterium caligoides]|uniref:Voltage-gated potassium channel n=1 Tax=Sinobacterium caligoides TaxID=933926 RepID=A0A3N2DZB0_9GAMM|nr:potassium channel family protein [Sinobacterium caligoides]ROS05150.1 voltage-gated potassium channel [Sinobacterium caligoides]